WTARLAPGSALRSRGGRLLLAFAGSLLPPRTTGVFDNYELPSFRRGGACPSRRVVPGKFSRGLFEQVPRSRCFLGMTGGGPFALPLFSTRPGRVPPAP